jgi:hypothetical protein
MGYTREASKAVMNKSDKLRKAKSDKVHQAKREKQQKERDGESLPEPQLWGYPPCPHVLLQRAWPA